MLKANIINYVYLSILIFGTISIISCKSLEDFSSSNELGVKPPEKFPDIEIPTYDDLVNKIINLDSITKQSILNNIDTKNLSISEYYNPKYLDSLKSILNDTGSLKINENESFLIESLKDYGNKDTIYLTNLHVQTPKNGETKSFVFEVEKGDHIYYEFKNLKSNTIEGIELIEGSETRFIHNRLKGKEQVNGTLKVKNDNSLTLNISNNNFIKNKGLFQSELKVVLKKIAGGQNIIIKKIKDSIIESKEIIEEKNDTVFKIIDSKKFNLSPKLDITKSNKYKFNITIDELEDVIGWGFWIGYEKTAIKDFEVLSENENALINFSKAEIKNNQSIFYLPKTKNTDIDLAIKTLNLDARSLNYANNYAFFKTDSNSSLNKKKAEIYLTNKSNLYDYDVYYYIVAVGLQKVKVKEIKNFVKIKTKIQLKIVQDE